MSQSSFSRYKELLIQNRSFRHLWLGQTLSYTGNSVYDITLMWFVFAKTGSAVQVSVIMIASFLPEVVFGLFFGALVDRGNRKRIMQFCDGMQAVILLLLAFAFFTNAFQMWQLYVFTVCQSLLGLLFSNAQGAWLPELVQRDHLMTAYSLMTTSRQTMRLIGSAAGGALVTTVGATTSVAYDALTFVASLLFVQFIPYVLAQRASSISVAKTSMFAEIGEGIRWLLGQRALLLMMIIGTLSNVALGPTNVLPAVYITKVMHSNAGALGIFDASIGCGILFASLLMGYFSPQKVGRWFAFGLALQGCSMTLVVFAPHLLIAYAGNFLLGVGVIVTGLPMGTLMQVLTPADKRGRVSSISSLGFNLSIPISYGGNGLLATSIGTRSTYALGAGLLLLCGLAGYVSSQVRQSDLQKSTREQATSV